MEMSHQHPTRVSFFGWVSLTFEFAFNILIKIIENYNNFININYFHAWCCVLLICFIDTFLFKSYNLHDNIHIFEFRRW